MKSTIRKQPFHPVATSFSVAAIMLGLSAGCSSSGSSGEDGASSCARQLQLGDRTYLYVLSEETSPIEVTTGAKLGTAKLLPCDDAEGRGESPEAATAWEPTVHQVEGLDSSLAIAVAEEGEPVELFAYDQEGSDLPAAVQEFIDRGGSGS